MKKRLSFYLFTTILCFKLFSQDGSSIFSNVENKFINDMLDQKKDGRKIYGKSFIVPDDKALEGISDADLLKIAKEKLEELIILFKKYPEIGLNENSYIELEKKHNFTSLRKVVSIRTRFLSELELKGYAL
jgi:hypothetical protein